MAAAAPRRSGRTRPPAAWCCSRHGPAGLVILFVLILTLVSTGRAAEPPVPPGVVDLTFDRAEFATGDGPGAPDAGWTPASLPDNWHFTRPRLTGFGWYRVVFRLDAVPGHALALLAPRVAKRGEFRLNGTLLNPGVRFDAHGQGDGTQMALQPQLLHLPPEVLRAGTNVLLVKVQGSGAAYSGLHPMRLASPETLRPAWLLREVPQQLIPKVLLVLLCAVLVIGLATRWRHGHALTRHLLLVTAMWAALVATNLGLWSEPVAGLGVALIVTLLIAFNWALLALCFRFSASSWTWFPPLLKVCGIAMLVAVPVLLALGQTDALRWLVAPTIPLRALATVMLARWAWQERSARALALSGSEALWFAGFVQWVGVALGVLPNWPFVLSPADSLPLFVVLVVLEVNRMLAERDTAVREREAAIGAERERLLHDMHDGVGSQLTTALRLAQQDPPDPPLLVRTIDDALQDLRLIIDSLDLADQALLPLLGNLRHRLAPRLAALGIRLDWEAQPLPPIEGLTPQSALLVLRIVQEAIHNAVRHADASVIGIGIAPDPAGGASVCVTDNGRGGVPLGSGGDPMRQRGLRIMGQRAARLGAELRIGPAAGDAGTRLELRLPPKLADDREPRPV